VLRTDLANQSATGLEGPLESLRVYGDALVASALILYGDIIN